MIVVKQFLHLTADQPAQSISVELPYDLRKKSRLRTQSTCGRDVGIQLPRGSELRDGQQLLAEDGTVITVIAASEVVSTVTADDPLLLLKAAYHLGNRHMPLQIAADWLRYQHDHVLDDMVVGLGLRVSVESASFQPESGAYHRHGDGGHSHGNSAVNSHVHDESGNDGHHHGHHH